MRDGISTTVPSGCSLYDSNGNEARVSAVVNTTSHAADTPRVDASLTLTPASFQAPIPMYSARAGSCNVNAGPTKPRWIVSALATARRSHPTRSVYGDVTLRFRSQRLRRSHHTRHRSVDLVR